MKRWIGLLGLVTPLCAVPLVACLDDTGLGAKSPAIDEGSNAIIGGLSATSGNLNAVGALGLQYNYYGYAYFEPFCSGTLIGEQTVLTAKHCVAIARQADGRYATAMFGIGPDAMNPTRLVEIVDIDEAPGNEGGFVGFGQDVGTVHLGEKIPAREAKPMKTAALTNAMVGTNFAVLGYGVSDNTGAYGTRRVGTVKLQALRGKVFELMFGSFEAFKDWYLGNGYYAGTPLPVALATPTAADAGVPITPDAMQSEVPPPDAGIGEDAYDWLTEYLLAVYNETILLDGYEAYVGNAAGNAQPCYGDSGGPLLRMVGGELTVYGVTSGGIQSQTMVCDFGGVYATFGTQVASYLRTALAWKDPCDGISRLGVCKRSASHRCTYPAEGKRRVVITDCSLLGQGCVMASNGQALCAYPGEDPVPVGGIPATGGMPVGGMPTTGGVMMDAGLPGTGGIPGVGGVRATGGASSTGGRISTATSTSTATSVGTPSLEAKAAVTNLIATAKAYFRPSFAR